MSKKYQTLLTFLSFIITANFLITESKGATPPRDKSALYAKYPQLTESSPCVSAFSKMLIEWLAGQYQQMNFYSVH